LKKWIYLPRPVIGLGFLLPKDDSTIRTAEDRDIGAGLIGLCFPEGKRPASWVLAHGAGLSTADYETSIDRG
jgi:hypothetical protein